MILCKYTVLPCDMLQIHFIISNIQSLPNLKENCTFYPFGVKYLRTIQSSPKCRNLMTRSESQSVWNIILAVLKKILYRGLTRPTHLG